MLLKTDHFQQYIIIFQSSIFLQILLQVKVSAELKANIKIKKKKFLNLTSDPKNFIWKCSFVGFEMSISLSVEWTS